MMKILPSFVIAALCGAAFVTAPPAAACEKFVGGICLDSKSEPAKKKTIKKKTVKKKKVRKKAVKKKAVVRKKTAAQCITMKERAGTLRKRLDRRMYYAFTNNCDKPIKALLVSNSCYKPRGHFESTRTTPRWTTTIGAKKRKTISIVQAEKLYKDRAKGVHGIYFFTTDPKAGRASYPRWPFKC